MPHFGVYNLESDISGRPHHRIKRALARDLVARGLARMVNEYSIQLLTPPERSFGLRSRQGEAIEARAIEKFPREAVGGLARTETRPATIKPFSGARVGHQ